MTEAAARPTGRRGQRLTYLVKQLQMAERARMEEVLRPLGVTLQQYTALSLLERREGLSSAQLARRHYVTPQAMHQLVASMERDGLIEGRIGRGPQRLGQEGMVELIGRQLAAGLAGEELLDAAVTEVRELNGEELTDDVALLLLESGA